MDTSTKFLCTTSKVSLPTFTFIALLLFCSTYQIVLASHNNVSTPTNRLALEIGIGGGGIDIGGGSPSPESSPNCPSPPPPPPPKPACPPPPSLPPPSPVPRPPPRPTSPSRVEIATQVIQQFKKRIVCDPKGVLKTWTGRNACDYTGFRCAFNHDYGQSGVYTAQFNELGLNSSKGIQNFIEKLPDMSIFHANTNGFTAEIPDISKLRYLFELDLSNNGYNGPFPGSVLGATQLTFLDLRFNFFTGPVPPQVFNLNLLALFLNNNKFQQNLPSNLGSTPVAFLTLANNEFTGPIPKSIGQASKTLLEVLFLNNQLSGCLPYEIGLLKKARLFDASKNQLTGPIPHSFACMAGMQSLVLAQNQLFGTVPEMVCKLPKLANLSLSYNYFTEVGPECMKLIWNKVLDVKMNCISGQPNQRTPEECRLFFNKPTNCPESNANNKYIPCKGTAAYLDSTVALEGVPHPQPTVTYGALTPKSN